MHRVLAACCMYILDCFGPTWTQVFIHRFGLYCVVYAVPCVTLRCAVFCGDVTV
jgi:hypothetical protein